jgi:hypothetical protein
MKSALSVTLQTPWRAALASFSVGLALTVSTGCGGKSGGATEQSSGGSAGTSNANGGDGGTLPANSGGSAGTSDAGACPVPELGPPISGPPGEIGCFEGVNGRWQKVQCLCDFWVDSPATTDTSARLSLSVVPNSDAALNGDLAMNVVFPDADAAWFDIWQQQAENGAGFAVTHASDGTTTVHLSQSAVALAPVPLRACESRHAHATVEAPSDTIVQLRMVADLADDSGNPLPQISSSCSPLHPL